MDKRKGSFAMRKSYWLFLLMFVTQPTGLHAATKDAERPDKEMLRMIDFLKDWEVIDNMEMMKDMHQVARAAEQGARAGTLPAAPPRKKETAK